MQEKRLAKLEAGLEGREKVLAWLHADQQQGGFLDLTTRYVETNGASGRPLDTEDVESRFIYLCSFACNLRVLELQEARLQKGLLALCVGRFLRADHIPPDELIELQAFRQALKVFVLRWMLLDRVVEIISEEYFSGMRVLYNDTAAILGSVLICPKAGDRGRRRVIAGVKRLLSIGILVVIGSLGILVPPKALGLGVVMTEEGRPTTHSSIVPVLNETQEIGRSGGVQTAALYHLPKTAQSFRVRLLVNHNHLLLMFSRLDRENAHRVPPLAVGREFWKQFTVNDVNAGNRQIAVRDVRGSPAYVGNDVFDLPLHVILDGVAVFSFNVLSGNQAYAANNQFWPMGKDDIVRSGFCATFCGLNRLLEYFRLALHVPYALSRSLSSAARFVSLPTDESGCDPSDGYEYPLRGGIPAWRLIVVVVIVASSAVIPNLGSGGSCWGDRWWVLLLCGLGFLGGALFGLAPWGKVNSEGQHYCGDKGWFHVGEIVPQKYLDSHQLLGYSNSSEAAMANFLNTDKQIAVIGALAEGSSIRSIERITGVHRDTIMRLGVKVGQGCAAVMDSKMRDLSCNRLEMDEIWGFVGKKERHVREGDSGVGSVWTFCAIDAETKLVPAFKVGDRGVAHSDRVCTGRGEPDEQEGTNLYRRPPRLRGRD